MYSKKLMKYFKEPKNAGKIKNADGVGKAGNPLCGDIMHMYIKIKDGKIQDAKFETLGCAAAIAMSDRVIEMIKGKNISEVKKLKPADIARGFNLPKIKIHCSVLGIEALGKAIEDYEANIKLKTKSRVRN